MSGGQMRPRRREPLGVVGGEEPRIGGHRLLEATQPEARGSNVAEGEMREATVERIARGFGGSRAPGAGLDGTELVHGVGVAALLVGAHRAAKG